MALQIYTKRITIHISYSSQNLCRSKVWLQWALPTTLFILINLFTKQNIRTYFFGFENIHMFWIWKHTQYYFNNIHATHILYNSLNHLIACKFRFCFILWIQLLRNYITPRYLFYFTNNWILLYHIIFCNYLFLIHCRMTIIIQFLSTDLTRPLH